MMKFVFAVALLCAFAATAETLPQERIKAARVAYLSRELSLSPEEAEKFWPVYNLYDEQREDLRARIRDLMDESRTRGYSSDDKANAALDEMLSIREQELQLEKNFRKSMQGILPSRRLVVLHQAEREFQKELIRRIQDRREPIRPNRGRR
jgi:Skp family chaperone for outer membrane proteins